MKQAARVWNKKFTREIEKFGFVICKSDPCIFVSKKNNKLIILAIHVDDGIIAGDDEDSVVLVLKHLKKHFEIKEMDLGLFLGLEIKQRANGSVFNHQTAYAKRILRRFRLDTVLMNRNQVNTHTAN